jgi:hypothetical protein
MGRKQSKSKVRGRLASSVLRLFLGTFSPYRINPSEHHPLNLILIEPDRQQLTV